MIGVHESLQPDCMSLKIIHNAPTKIETVFISNIVYIYSYN